MKMKRQLAGLQSSVDRMELAIREQGAAIREQGAAIREQGAALLSLSARVETGFAAMVVALNHIDTRLEQHLRSHDPTGNGNIA